jgi:pyroglutamyl-peptidase
METTSPRICFYITGFGKFGTVIENPTSILVNKIADLFKECAFPLNVTLEYSKVVEVTITALKQAVHEINDKIKAQATPSKNIILHFGVSAGSPCFSLEQYGYNIAHFSIPDNEGNQPKSVCIIDTLDFKKPLETKMDLKNIQCMADPSRCKISSNPGTYICNYTYLYSMHVNCSETVLFVHFPSFTTICEKDQACFVTNLLKAIVKDTLASPKC